MYLMFDVIRLYLGQNEFDIKLTVENIRELIVESEEHQLLPFIFHVLKKNYSNDSTVLSEINKCKHIVYRQTLINKYKLDQSVKIIHKFNNHNIKYVVLKGLGFKEVYSNEDTRLMSDIDILVHQEHYSKASQILFEDGYNILQEQENECNLCFVKNDTLSIELHHKLFPKAVFGEKLYLEENIFFNIRSIYYNSIEVKVPGHDFAIAYAILHMAKHFSTSGFGIRQILDFVLYAKYYVEMIDMKNIYHICAMYGINLFLSHVLELCNTFFDCNYTIIDNINIEKLEYLKKFVIDSGVYGHRHIDRDVEAVYINRLQSKNGIIRLNFFSRLKLIFPNANSLSYKYKYAKNYKVLLPFAWLHRIKHNVFSNNKLRRKLVFSNPDSENITERYSVIQYFNLQKKVD